MTACNRESVTGGLWKMATSYTGHRAGGLREGGREGVYRPEGHFGGPAREAWQGKQRAAKNFNCLDYRRKTRAEACPPNTLTLSDHRSRIPNGQLNKRAAPIKERVEIRKMQNVYFQNLLVEEFPESSWIFQAVGGQITQLAISIWRVDHWTERLFQGNRREMFDFKILISFRNQLCCLECTTLWAGESISENMYLCWSLRMSIQTGIYFISISAGGRRGDVFIEIFQFWRESDKSFYCTRSNLSQFVWICFLFKPLPSENPLFVFFVAPRKHSLTS